MFKVFLSILFYILLVAPSWGLESIINKPNVVQNIGKILMIKKQNSISVIKILFKNGDYKEYMCDKVKIFKLAFDGDLIKRIPLTCKSLKKDMLVKVFNRNGEIIFYVSEINKTH